MKADDNRHTEKTPGKFSQYGIYKKVLLITLILSVTPILIFGLYTILTLDTTGDDIVNEIENVLDSKVRETLELQAHFTASSVTKFLKQREIDLLNLAEIIPTEKHYFDFYKLHKSEIWIRTGYNETPHEAKISIPMYKEISFIDKNGWEKIRITNNSVIEKKNLKDVSKPENTTYGVENYFEETIRLKPFEIYVSHVTGFYITEHEQLGDADNIEEAVETPIYNGVVRMAMPVYNNDNVIGIVMIAIDHQHFMEFTQHILPNSSKQTVFPSYNSGNYAFMFDDRGWIITHPKYWDIPGIDENGDWVKAYSENSSEEDIKAGRIPFNLDTAGFVHPNYPIVAKAVRNKETGSKVTTNIGGIQKVMAYAPILYSTGQYEKHGIFGGITIGAEFNQFQESTAKVASDLSDIIILLRNNITVFVLLTFVITVIGSWLFSKNLTDPILAITGDAKRIASGEDVQIGTIHRNDEIGVLSNTIGYMAQELKRSNEELKESLVSLQDSKSEIENYAKDLEYQITIFSTIQRISNILGSTTPMEKVLKEILRSCKESLRFDRTVLYLRDDNNKYLEYTENYGLSKEEERSAKNARYNIYDQDCIETRVLRTGEIIFVEDFKNYSEATEFDKRIYQSSKSDSFVYVPLKAKENIIGILGADRNHTKEKIKEIDINSLQIFANQASRIIENSQLYQEISEQRNFFENIIRFMIKGVVTIDVKGVITSINRTACEILHVERESVLGMEIVSYLENFQDFPELINKLITESITKADINEMRMNVNGKIISANITAIESEESDLAGYIVLLEDVTEKKRLDDHLHDLDRLASLGKFAAGIAHEIRNPLTGLSVFLDDLHDKLSSQVENSRFISLALSEIGRLERLVNELLDYATPHSAQMDYHDLNTLIESTLHFTEKQCRDAGIKVEVFYEKNLPKIHVDSGKIQQALLNMILNAIQAIGKNGKIRISTKISVESEFLSVFERGTRKISKWIKIIIEDSGSGISKELQSKIFEPFVTEKKGGTGLGLSITQSIISEHNGKIELADTDLQGASFIIYLPAIKER